MGEVKHSDRKHALLSASGASRWINCTPSPRIEEKFADKGSSPYAAEGTLAHEFGDLGLQKVSKQITAAHYNKLIIKHKQNEYYTDEMEDEVQKYINYVMEQFNDAKQKTPDAHLLIEEKIDLTDFIEEGFGTGDAGIIADGCLEVIDLKYGKGVRVSAEDNSQLKLYGLGMLVANELSFDIETVRLTIVQPRLDHISSWEISADDLRNWGEHTIKPKAKLAYEGKGLQQAGDWCRWCKAKPRCATLASQSMKVAKHEFRDPHLLTNEQLMMVYKQMPQIQDWVSSVASYLLDEALKGKKWPGLKLVEGRSNRKWKNDKEVMAKLNENNFGDDEILVSKLAGITAIEKLVGKPNFASMLGDLVIKPQGKPSLVDESDKRPAIGNEQAKSDFSD